MNPSALTTHEASAATQARQASDVAQAAGGISDQKTRAWLAFFFVVAGLSVIAIFGALDEQNPPQTNADKVFTSLLGIVGAWVSTILVFYFSRENFQAAQKAVNQAVTTGIQAAQAGSAAAGSTVGAAMTSLDKLRSLALDNRDESAIPLCEICNLFDEITTRIPIISDGVAKYVIHDTSLFRFIADRTINNQPVDPTTATLKDFLDHKFKNGDIPGKTVREVVGRFVTLPDSSTLADARAALLQSNGAQDVVCTQNGRPTEKMLGLLTNDDISKIIQG